jgi:hypothetical protein
MSVQSGNSVIDSKLSQGQYCTWSSFLTDFYFQRVVFFNPISYGFFSAWSLSYGFRLYFIASLVIQILLDLGREIGFLLLFMYCVMTFVTVVSSTDL